MKLGSISIARATGEQRARAGVDSRRRRVRRVLLLLAVTVGLFPFAASLQAAEAKPAGAAAAKSNKLISLVDVSPELFWAVKHRLKFYGDANTIRSADIFKRSYLLGGLNGLRDYLTDNGVFIDSSVTQFLAGNLSGGTRVSPSPRGNGSANLWVLLDSAKMGLWSGGLLFIRGEAQWSTSVNGDVGTLLPANFDASMPSPGGGNAVALPELYFVQALPNNFVVTIGKVNLASFADTNFFANSENSQFIYTGLVNNPMLGVFAPYTALSAGLTWVSPNKKHTIGALFSQTDGTATSPGFDTLFNGANTYAGYYKYSSAINGRPGNFQIMPNYTTKNVASFAIDRRQLIKQLIGVVPVIRKENNYGVMINIDQYLWVRKNQPTGRKGLPPVGVGVFARAGWAPKGRNVIDQFYSFGIGGYGVLIAGRDNDNWGVGWAGTHLSSDLRRLVGSKLKTWEHAVELFYNFELTPATHLSLNAQIMRTPLTGVNTAFALGARLRFDF